MTQSNQAPDVSIIGSGIMGLLTARELAMAGLSVCVYERGELARAASWAAGGILSPMHPEEVPSAVQTLVAWSQNYYAQLTEELQARTGIDAQLRNTGYLRLSSSTEYACANPQEHIPQLNYQGDAAWYPHIGQLRNPRLLKALCADIERLGVEVRPHTDIRAIHTDNDKVTYLRTETNREPVNQLVVCAGPWSRKLVNQMQAPAIYPVRGQMLLLEAPKDWLPVIVHLGKVYCVPRADGSILLGSTIEHAGFDDQPTKAAADYLLSQAVPLLPELETFNIQLQWAGLRPGSAAGIPTIGQHPRINNCWLNAGHYRNGIVTAPASARLLKNLMLAEQPIVSPKPYTWSG